MVPCVGAGRSHGRSRWVGTWALGQHRGLAFAGCVCIFYIYGRRHRDSMYSPANTRACYHACYPTHTPRTTGAPALYGVWACARLTARAKCEMAAPTQRQQHATPSPAPCNRRPLPHASARAYFTRTRHHLRPVAPATAHESRTPRPLWTGGPAGISGAVCCPAFLCFPPACRIISRQL